MPAHKAAPVRGGAIDADTLRQRWPEVLNAVKGQRRIAWMLLGPATVESLEGGVLTVAFPKEGEAKGFASSGCDQVLATALGTLLGLNVRVRAVVGISAPGPGPRTPPRSAPQAPVPQAPAPGATGPDAPPGGPEPAPEDPLGSAAPGGPANQAAAPHPAPAAGNPVSKASSRRGAADSRPAAPEEWPDDAGPAGDAPAVTGMELIERQLGGRVIEEIEEP
jgi:DNA polymerase-3 subunit gamma/tau